jgi:hypothetical protein
MSTVRYLERALQGDVNWPADDVPALVDAAEDHGVSALLWDLLSGAPEAQLPLRRALASRARAAVARDLLVSLELSDVLGAMAAGGIRTLLIKGAPLAYTVYEHPWHRPRLDTDLLVAAADVEAAARVLTQCGYDRCEVISTGAFVSHQVAFERSDAQGLRHVIDLHWKIVNPQLLANAVPFEELWIDSVAVPALGAAARMPSPVNALLIGCIHRLAHHQGHDRLIWLYDLRLLARQLDDRGWNELRRRAQDRGVAGVCLDGLLQARQRVSAAVPPGVEQALAGVTGEPSTVYLRGPVRRRDVLASDLALLPGWRARLRLLREHAFPSVAFIRARYGCSSRAMLPLAYVHRLVTGACTWLWR